jgi:hypothetical protein
MNHKPSVGDTVWLLEPSDFEPQKCCVRDVYNRSSFVEPEDGSASRVVWDGYLYPTELDALRAAFKQATAAERQMHDALAEMETVVKRCRERLVRAEEAK